MQRKKSLFLYLKTGGGHLAPAKSLANYIQNSYDGYDIELVDGFAESKKIAEYAIVDGYRIMQSKTKWLYELIYAFNKIKPFAYNSAFIITLFVEKYLKRKILEEKPDSIVVFHFLLIQPVYKIIQKHKLNTKVFTVVTDPFTAHPLWFLNKNQNLIVFSEKLKAHCIRNGFKEDQINVFPFILNEKFSRPATENEKIEIKKNLGYKSEKILLILGGGDGIPNGMKILKKILQLNDDIEIAFVCGKNKNLFSKITDLKKEQKLERLKVYGYVDFVYELLNISDVVISKCGASTFMEILFSRKIPVVNSYIWEQEKGNVDFLVQEKLGIYEKRVGKLPGLVNELFENESLLAEYRNNLEALSLENGNKKVADFLVKSIRGE